jgi:hypothetical protein
VLNSEILLEENTYICGTLHLDRGVTKEMKEKIKYLKKGQSITEFQYKYGKIRGTKSLFQHYTE